MARRRRRNPKKNHSGLGAFLGSLAGGVPGHIVTALGSKTAGGVLTSIGWILGGAAGGHFGAKTDRKRRAAIGGAIGGIFTPLGAALGGYLGGRKADRRRNPAGWVLPAAVGGAVVAGGTGVLVGMKIRDKKKADTGTAALPASYEQVMCSPYEGHQICVYSYVNYEGNRAYDAAVDGGKVLELDALTAEGAVMQAQQIVDAMTGAA